MMFAFTMLWAYVNFSQYLIVWSGNVPEEISWYLARFRGGWGWVGLAVLVFHFVLPFLLLALAAGQPQPAHARRRGGAPARHALRGRGVARAARLLPGRVPLRLDGPRRAGRPRRDSGSRSTRGTCEARPLLPVNDPGFEEALAHGHD